MWAVTAVAIRLAVMFLGPDGVSVVKCVALIYLPLAWILRTRRDPADFGLVMGDWRRQLLLVGVVCLVTLPPVWFGEHLLETRWLHRHFHLRLPPSDLPGRSAGTSFAYFVAGELLGTGLPEEVFYRGYLQTRLDGVLPGRIRILGAEVGWALPIASVVFVLGHLAVRPAVWEISIFFPSLVFGWLFLRTRSLFAPVLYHAICNIGMHVLQSGYR